MSHRTRDLPPLTGLPRLIREFRYHEFTRQALGLLMVLVYALVAQPIPTLYDLGALLVIVGLMVRLYASGYIIKNQVLAKDGPYSLVRHPLYTGNALVLIGFTAAAALWWVLAFSIFFFWFWYPAAIEYEDRKLQRIFGAEWEEWAVRTPAIVPRTLKLVRGDGQWSLATSLRRNAEPVIIVYVLFWLAWISGKL